MGCEDPWLDRFFNLCYRLLTKSADDVRRSPTLSLRSRNPSNIYFPISPGFGTVMITRILARLRPLALVDLKMPAPIVRVSDRRKAFVVLSSAFVAFAVLHFGLAVAGELFQTVRDPVYSDKELKLSRLERSLPPSSPVVVYLGTSRTANGFAAGSAQEVLTAESRLPSRYLQLGFTGDRSGVSSSSDATPFERWSPSDAFDVGNPSPHFGQSAGWTSRRPTGGWYRIRMGRT